MRRRSFCTAALGLALPPAFAATESAEDRAKRRRWLKEFHQVRLRDAKGALRLQKFRDDMYIVLEPIEWRPGHDQPAHLPSVTVPRGFVTDLTSIPPIFFAALRADGPYGFAAIVHDYLYWTQTCTRDAADTVFELAMRDFEISTVDRVAIISAVKLAGGWAWDGNTKLRKTGECRLLKELPSDPTVKWSSWKKRAGVMVCEGKPSKPVLPTAKLAKGPA